MNKIKIVYGNFLETVGLEIFQNNAPIENNFNSNESSYINQGKTNQKLYKKNFARESSELHVKGNKSRVSLGSTKEAKNIAFKL